MIPANEAPDSMDTGNEVSPEQQIIKMYTDEFISDIAVRFDMEMEPRELARELRNIGHRYIQMSRLPDRDALVREDRKEYTSLNGLTANFITALQAWASRDLAGEMAQTARSLNEPRPMTEFPDLTDHQRQRGDAYHYELLRLLTLLENSTDQRIRYLTSSGGRPLNYGLEILTRKAADFWTERLGRRFTIAYHQGIGTTRAFDFVQALLEPFDEVTDIQITTAMRAEVKSRNSGPTNTRHGKKHPKLR